MDFDQLVQAGVDSLQESLNEAAAIDAAFMRGEFYARFGESVQAARDRVAQIGDRRGRPIGGDSELVSPPRTDDDSGESGGPGPRAEPSSPVVESGHDDAQRDNGETGGEESI